MNRGEAIVFSEYHIGVKSCEEERKGESRDDGARPSNNIEVKVAGRLLIIMLLDSAMSAAFGREGTIWI